MLSAFADDFIETYAKANNRWSEVDNKRRILKNHLEQAFGGLRLDEINERRIEQYKAKKIRDGLSPKTINNTLSCLRKMLDVARDWKLIDNVPRFRWAKSAKVAVKFLDFDKAHALVQHTEVEWRPMVITALKTGLRHGELLALRWSKGVDFETQRVNVIEAMYLGKTQATKTGLVRSIPMAPTLEQTLKELYLQRRSDLVFVNADGNQLTTAQCRWPLWRACDKAGIERISWHVFRHTFASHLAMKGVSMKVIQELLGHTTINTTMRYAHLCEGALAQAVQVLE